MQYTTLGTTGITIPRLCIGGMSFGQVFPDFHQWVIDQPSTQAVIARALELGVTFIDTANVYARGTSEEYIGQSLRNLGVAREDVVLASKVYFNEGHLSAEAIEREITGTLQRLGTDYLDLYIIYRFDYSTPVEETMEALDRLVRDGRVRAWVPPPCTPTSCTTCRWRRTPTAGPASPACRTTTTSSTARTSGR